MDLSLGHVFIIFILVMSVILHEIAHGYVAYLCGDPTAAQAGRLTLNPIPHIDPIMTILVPAVFIVSGSPFIFGGAKPVPVNPFLFRRMPRDYLLVALAGVTVNFLIATALAGLVQIPILSDSTRGLLAWGAVINIFLGVFNLVPIPPLDGSKVVEVFLPDHAKRAYMRLQPYGFMIIIALFYFHVLDMIIIPAVLLVAALLQLPLHLLVR